MLIIRPAQIEAFEKASRGRFEKNALARWKSRQPQPAATADDAIRATIESGIQRAVGYGLRNENHLFAFLDLIQDLGGEFDSVNDWAKHILRDGDLTAALKIYLLEEGARQRAAASHSVAAE